MTYNYSYTFDGEGIEALSIFFGIYFGIVLVMFFAMWLLLIISQWKLFKKAGYSGWKCLIPIYNLYIIMKIGRPETRVYHLLFFLIPIFNIFYALLVSYRFGKAFTDSDAVGILYVLFPMITGAVMAFSDKYQYRYKINELNF